MTPGASQAAKLWPAEPRERDLDRPLGQPGRAVAPGDLARQDPADRPVDVPHRDRAELHRLARARAPARSGARAPSRARRRAPAAGDASGGAACRAAGPGVSSTIDRSTRLRLPVVDRLVHVEQLGAPDHVLEAADAERGHDRADLLGHQHQVVDHLLGGAAEARAQLRDPGWRSRPGRC